MLKRDDIITTEPLPNAYDHLCYPWLLPGRFSLLIGPANIGKTTITLEIIAQLLRGDHLWERYPCKKIQRCLYLHGEHTLATLQEAAKARGDIPEGSITVVHEFGDNGSRLIEKGAPNTTLIKEIREVCDELKPELIIVEPLSAFLGTSENDNFEVRTLINILASLGAKYNAAVFGHHHVGKSHFDPEHVRAEGIATGEARGAMAFEDAAERVIYLRRDGDKKLNHIKLITPKAKGFPVSDLLLKFDEDTLTYSHVPVSKAERDVIAVYSRRRKYPNETIGDMIEYFRQEWACSPNKVMLMLKRARRVGLVPE